MNYELKCLLLCIKTEKIMNYEELVAARNDGRKHKTMQPIGGYYREQVDGKWRGVVDIRPELQANIVFTGAIKTECEKNKVLTNKHQIHFTPVLEDGDVKQLELEVGNFQTFEQLLIDNPAIVAQKDFIDNTLSQLVEITTFLHEHDIMHVCYSPKTVFARKGDNAVMLLSHGSFYLGMSNQQEFYGDDAGYVAPEVLENGTIDDRCDIYSIGRFMEAIFDRASMPMEFKNAVKRAVSKSPEDRFATPKDMLKAVQKRRQTITSVKTFVIALVVALVCVGLYFELFPETQPVEFVKPAPKTEYDDLLDDGFDPAELGIGVDDSLTETDVATQRDYEAKAEEIFRKKYEKEADRILSKIYNKEYMSNSEKKFMAESQSTMDELKKAQQELSGETGIDPSRSDLIASQVIERITDQKKKEMQKNK